MIFWSFNAIIIKWLLLTISPNMVVFLRISIATIFLILIYIVKKKNKRKFTLVDILYALFGGFFYIYLQLIIHFMGLERITAVDAVLVASIAPFVSMVFECFFFKRKFTIAEQIGVISAFVGIVISEVGYEARRISLVGISLVGVSVLIASMGGILIQKLSVKHESLTIALMIHISGLFFFMIDAFFFRGFDTSEFARIGQTDWIISIVFFTVNGGIASIVWSQGVRKLGLLKASAYLPLVPLFGVLISSVVFGDLITKWQIVGLAAVMSGGILINGISTYQLNKKYFER